MTYKDKSIEKLEPKLDKLLKDKVTKNNFEEFIKKHVNKKYRGSKLIGIKLPKNGEEFTKLAKNLYDIEITVDCMAYPKGAFNDDGYSCKYKVNEMESDYKTGEIYQLWEKEFSQYDGLKVLLDSCFGELSCGGVAGSHYGQTKCDKKTWDRVKNWDGESVNKVKNVKAAIEQHQELVNIFGHNPLI